jgi:DNA-binding IclR family transcriptional regulator
VPEQYGMSMMRHHEEQLLAILAEADEPLSPSEITDALNRRAKTVYNLSDVVGALKTLDQVKQTPDGRWTLKRRVP